VLFQRLKSKWTVKFHVEEQFHVINLSLSAKVDNENYIAISSAKCIFYKLTAHLQLNLVVVTCSASLFSIQSESEISIQRWAIHRLNSQDTPLKEWITSLRSNNLTTSHNIPIKVTMHKAKYRLVYLDYIYIYILYAVHIILNF